VVVQLAIRRGVWRFMSLGGVRCSQRVDKSIKAASVQRGVLWCGGSALGVVLDSGVVQESMTCGRLKGLQTA
jgi:hypothetical protein